MTLEHLMESEGVELLTEASGLSFRVSENVQLDEATKSNIDKTGLMVLKKVPATVLDEINGNGRMYTTQEMQKSIDESRSKGMFERRQLFCTGDDHPKTTYVPPVPSSHIVTDAYIETVGGKSVLFNDWLVLNTRNGQDLRAVVEAGGSIGTSIRGLGRQNEKTQAIENYRYLGTDSVGNPSSGTFANPREFEVTIESVDDQLATQVVEQLEEAQHSESDKGDTVMTFNLKEEIEKYKEKHCSEGMPDAATREMVQDILTMQQTAMSEGVDLGEEFDEFKNEMIGRVPEKPNKEGQDEGTDKDKKDAAKIEDDSNRLERSHTALEALVKELQTQLDEAQDREKDLKKRAEVGESLVTQFASETAALVKKMEDASSDEEQAAVVEEIKKGAIRAVDTVQTEARAVITQLESNLETAIRIGDEIANHFESLKFITDSLVETARPKDSDEYLHSRTSAAKATESQDEDNDKDSTRRRSNMPRGWS